jgi:competence protein ComEC
VLNKEIPFLRICVPLSIGIISGLKFNPGHTVVVLLTIISASGLLLSAFFNKRLTNKIFGLAFSFTLFSSGIILYNYEKNSISVLENTPSVFTGTLSDFPEVKGKSDLLTVRLNSQTSNGRTSAVKGSIIVYNTKDEITDSMKPGDIISFSCTPLPIVNRGNPYEFNYRFYMQSRGIRYYAFTSRRNIISIFSPETRNLRYSALIIRKRIINMYETRGITGRRLALASAITLGEKENLDPEQKEYFIRSGVMHIMAVSGLHAMILSLFVFNLLFFLKRRFNILRVIITIIFLWGFAFVTGLTPSVMRATLMFSFLQTGTLLRRRVNGINSILASAFILIIIRPSVIFDAGFLLSYSAVLFIVGFQREFRNLVIFRNRVSDLIWQSVAVTIIAQAGTLPLTITLFNRFPALFIITNVVIVPLSSLVVITGCLIPLFYPLANVSGLLALLLDRLAGATEYLTSKAASVPWSTIENIGFTWAECLTLALFIPLILSILIRKPRIKALYPLITLLLFLISLTIKNIATKSSNELIVYNTPGYATVGLRSGKSLLVFSENPDIPREVKRHSSVLGLRTDHKILTDSVLVIKAGDRRIIIYDKPVGGLNVTENADIIIIRGRTRFPASDLPLINKSGGQLVILAVAGTNIISSGSRSASIDNHIRSVNESGAIRIRL